MWLCGYIGIGISGVGFHVDWCELVSFCLRLCIGVEYMVDGGCIHAVTVVGQ